MSNAEWEKLRETLKKPASKESMEEAAEAFDKWEKTKPRKSRPTLVSLGYKKTYPSAIPLEKVSEEIAKNPQFYDLMKKVIAKEK